MKTLMGRSCIQHRYLIVPVQRKHHDFTLMDLIRLIVIPAFKLVLIEIQCFMVFSLSDFTFLMILLDFLHLSPFLL